MTVLVKMGYLAYSWATQSICAFYVFGIVVTTLTTIPKLIGLPGNNL